MQPTHAAAFRAPQKSATFLGVEIDLITSDELLQIVDQTIRSKTKAVVANHNLHSICLFHQNIPERDQFHDFYHNAQITVADGMSAVAVGRMYGQPITRDHRIAYSDWLPILLPTAVRNDWRVFYLGSAPNVAELGAEVLRAKYPGLQLAVHHGHFDTTQGKQENRQILQLIEAYHPHLLFAGMGMPRQECWIEQNISDISANVILSSGATLDYVAGLKRMAPRWMGRMGIEWLFRLVTEPRRLAHRYLVEPWTLLRVIVRHS